MTSTYESIDQARTGVQNLLIMHGAAMPEATRGHLVAAMAQGKLESIIYAHEALYSTHVDLVDEAREVFFALNELIVRYEFFGIMVEQRGPRMRLAVLRGSVDAETDPAIDPRFAPAAPAVPAGT